MLWCLYMHVTLPISIRGNVANLGMAPNNDVNQGGTNEFRNHPTPRVIGMVVGQTKQQVVQDLQNIGDRAILYRVKKLKRERLGFLLGANLMLQSL